MEFTNANTTIAADTIAAMCAARSRSNIFTLTTNRWRFAWVTSQRDGFGVGFASVVCVYVCVCLVPVFVVPVCNVFVLPCAERLSACGLCFGVCACGSYSSCVCVCVCGRSVLF